MKIQANCISIYVLFEHSRSGGSMVSACYIMLNSLLIKLRKAMKVTRFSQLFLSVLVLVSIYFFISLLGICFLQFLSFQMLLESPLGLFSKATQEYV